MKTAILPASALAGLAALAALAALATAPGCTCSRTPSLPAEAAADFGNYAAPAPRADDMVPYLTAARAAVEKRAAPPPAAPALPGRRVFVAFWPGRGGGPRGEAVVGSGNGGDLGEPFTSAAGRVASATRRGA